ncbi:MAG: lytic transglycosylase domain-containing protein [Proteobacteria bacterium]|nr:lytic transglycosylase domain-containing protein [Pseudomonadota bacterium]
MIFKRTIFVTVFFAALAMAFVADVRADIYSYTDEAGVIHFTNRKPSGKSAKRYKVYMKTPSSRMARPGVTPVMASDSNPKRYTRYDTSILTASQTHLIPQAFIRAVIRVESDYDPNVVSVAGAQGLMQLMPATGKRMGCTDPFDPHQNIMGGTRYLRYLANLFSGDMVLTIAGYHAGEGAVRKYNGVPPYSSTLGYIEKVLKFYYHYKEKYPA